MTQHNPPLSNRKQACIVAGSFTDNRLTQAAPSLTQRVWNVVSSVLKLVVGLFFYWTNSSLFAFSFIVGIIRDDDVAVAIQKIRDVWETQPFNTTLIGGIGSVLGGVGAFFSLPITFAVGSVLYAADLGSSMSKKAQSILKERATHTIL